jgi:hypothetical protein
VDDGKPQGFAGDALQVYEGVAALGQHLAAAADELVQRPNIDLETVFSALAWLEGLGSGRRCPFWGRRPCHPIGLRRGQMHRF